MPNQNEECTSLLGDTRSLPLYQRVSYSMGSVMNDMCASMWFSYMVLFLQAVMSVPPVISGLVILAGQLMDATITPVVGILADRMGTRRMWHFGGTLLVTFSFPLLFLTCPHCNRLWIVAMYYICLAIIFQCGWAAVQISHLAIITDISENTRTRTDLTSLRHMMSVCSSITVYLITWIVLHTTNSNGSRIRYSDGYKFRDMALIAISIGVVASVWFELTIKESSRDRRQRCAVPTVSLSSTLTRLFTTPLMLQVSLLFVSSRIFTTLCLIYMPLYLDERPDTVSESLATIPLTSYLASFVTAVTLRHVIYYFGNKITYLAGVIICFIASIWVRYNEWSGSYSQLYGIALFMGAGSSTTTITSLCITADFIGIHTEQGALIYSIVTFSDKICNGLVVMLIEYLKCRSKELCPNYYRNVLSYGSGIAVFLGLVVLATLANVDRMSLESNSPNSPSRLPSPSPNSAQTEEERNNVLPHVST